MLVKSLFTVTLAALALGAPSDPLAERDGFTSLEGVDGEVDSTESLDTRDLEVEPREAEFAGELDGHWFCPSGYPWRCMKKCIPRNTRCCSNGKYCPRGTFCFKCPRETRCCPDNARCRCPP